MFVRISLFAIAALLLGAHFFRASNFLLVDLCLAMPLLFLYKKRWSLILLQLAAYGATVSWLWAALQLVEFHQQAGRGLPPPLFWVRSPCSRWWRAAYELPLHA